MQEQLYIEIEDGVIKNHPAYESNLIETFGSVPSNWIPFTRVERPQPGNYQVVLDAPVYTIVEGICMDVWPVREMTENEKVEYDRRQEELQTLLNSQN